MSEHLFERATVGKYLSDRRPFVLLFSAVLLTLLICLLAGESLTNHFRVDHMFLPDRFPCFAEVVAVEGPRGTVLLFDTAINPRMDNGYLAMVGVSVIESSSFNSPVTRFQIARDEGGTSFEYTAYP
jgi:hypothetical protein